MLTWGQFFVQAVVGAIEWVLVVVIMCLTDRLMYGHIMLDLKQVSRTRGAGCMASYKNAHIHSTHMPLCPLAAAGAVMPSHCSGSLRRA